MASALRLAASVGLVLALSARAQSATGITAIFQDGLFPTSRYAGTSDVIITEHNDLDQDPDASYSSIAYLKVDGFSARQTSLLRFPVGPGALPPGANVTGAELVIFVRDGTLTGTPFYEALRPWDQDQATFLQARSGEPWDGGGASSPGADRGGEPIAKAPQVPASGLTIVPFNDAGVDLVRRWSSGASPNHGLVAQDFDSWDELYFDSFDGPNPPELKVTYNAGTTADMAVFLPSADTMLAYQPPSFDGWGIGASGRAGELSATLIRWDLRAIPPGVTVAGAQLDVTVNRIGSSDGGNPFRLYPSEKPWTEAADWLTYDGQNQWVGEGSSDLTDHGTALDSLPVCGDAGQTCVVDLRLSKGVIQGWTNDPASNRGFLIQNYSNSDELQLLDSETPVIRRRPRLVVSFTWPSGLPTALFPAFAEVSTGERVQMMAFGGDGGYVYSVTGSSGASIDSSAGLYVAGSTPGQDLVQVVDLGGAGTPASAVIVVYAGGSVADAGQPVDGGGGGGGFPVSIALAGPADAVKPRERFTITADITNQASFTLFGMTLALAPDALMVEAPTRAGGVLLPGDATAGYALPAIPGGETVRLVIPGTMTAVPPESPSLTVTVVASGAPVASEKLPVALGTLSGLQTGCTCDAGTGGLSLVVALALARALRRRRAR